MGKPLVFGDESPVEKYSNPDPDHAYLQPDRIGGYSERVRANDIAKAQYPVAGVQGGLTPAQKEAYYQKLGAAPGDLPFQFRWLRVSNAAGGNSYNADVEMMRARHEGWELVNVKTKNEFKEKFGFDFPDTGNIMPDGTIRRMDVALAYVDGDRARELEAAQDAKRKQDLEFERGGGVVSTSRVAQVNETVNFESEGVVSEEKGAVKTSPLS